MPNYVIIGAGASGLYTAYRLLTTDTLQEGDSLTIYEWSTRVGGRIYTFEFPEWLDQKLYVELGGMRFAVDSNWPHLSKNDVNQGHVLVQSMILDLGLQGLVTTFGQSSNRMYYLRGRTYYENDLSVVDVANLPNGFNTQFNEFIRAMSAATNITADSILGQIATNFAPGLQERNEYRKSWCDYFASGMVPANQGTTAFPAGTPIRDIGYWNLLYDQLGDEGFDYSADGTGYTSNVINWNSADAMQANNDYSSGTSYMRLDGGYSQLFNAMASAIEAKGVTIEFGQQCTSLVDTTDGRQTVCTFVDGDGASQTVTADVLFLAMPRRGLEMIAAGSPASYMLNQSDVKYWLESSIGQPAIKAVLVFDSAWWTKAPHAPHLVWPNVGTPPAVTQWIGGATITDLPSRMMYYFANNVPNGPGETGGPYVLLASYDDMNYTSFWRELELTGDYPEVPSSMEQPLTGPKSMNPTGPFAQLLLKQLAEVHGMQVTDIPTPLGVYLQDWGQDPYGGGYHGWSSHYNICQAMDKVSAPYAQILVGSQMKTYIVGSCYSFDQAWVEGAFCTAEAVLERYFGVRPMRYATNYHLVCKPSD